METQKRGRLAEYAYEYTKGLLVEGSLQPGERVRVEEVVAQLNTSRQPVMDAFKRLASEGFIEIIPQVGCRVVTPNREEIEDFFLILTGIESTAAEVAATRRTPEEITDLRVILSDHAALRERPDSPERTRAFRTVKRDFHHALHAMAHSPTIANLAAALWDRSDFYLTMLVESSDALAKRISASYEEHVNIFNAIESRDQSAARIAMEEHIAAYAARS